MEEQTTDVADSITDGLSISYDGESNLISICILSKNASNVWDVLAEFM